MDGIFWLLVLGATLLFYKQTRDVKDRFRESDQALTNAIRELIDSDESQARSAYERMDDLQREIDALKAK
jgi:hypothetical protein